MYLFSRAKKIYFPSTYFREWQVIEKFASTYFCKWQVFENFEFIHFFEEEVRKKTWVSLKMPVSVVNYRLLSRYEILLRNLYTEPKYEEIMGTFLSITNKSLTEVKPPHPQRKKIRKSS